MVGEAYQVYEVAPKAVIVELKPGQTESAVAAKEMFG